MNNLYFDKSRSAAVFSNGDDRCILEMIASRFIGEHPAVPYQYKMDFDNGIKCNTKGRYQFDFGSRFPNAAVGSKCMAQGRLWSFHELKSVFVLTCNGPTICRLNGIQIFRSEPELEGMREVCQLSADLQKGWNNFYFETEKTAEGFGFTFGNSMAQWEPYLFQSLHPKRDGQLGFDYSEPVNPAKTEKFDWYPEMTGSGKENQLVWDRVFGENCAGSLTAKARVVMGRDGQLSLTGDVTSVYVDGREMAAEKPIALAGGEHLILVHWLAGTEPAAGKCTIRIDGGDLKPWIKIQGYRGSWLYLGPFHEIDGNTLLQICLEDRVERVYTDGGRPRHWRTAVPHGVVRICAEAELYGRWTYPMGVTLYGILAAADYLERPDYEAYVRRDVELITAHQDYAWYDKERFGFPSVNQQICWLTELDDCGSFGALMLECDKHRQNEAGRRLAQVIADFMRNSQCRRPDGVFCRRDGSMWIDDLYMSIPFLVRYHALSLDSWYLDEACRQMKLFRSYCFIENTKLMSHIYDIRSAKANEIPWSRGNGWVMFSLSELLNVLPETHPDRPDLVDFYRDMAEGLLKVQGVNGLWHQVLDDADTYEESSSTAMFVCAFSRGVRMGCAGRALAEKLSESVKRAWYGLGSRAVDCQGNLYGVSQGSGQSFDREYYRSLMWRYNDAHGIGIVLLAGVEACRLKEWEQARVESTLPRHSGE